MDKNLDSPLVSIFMPVYNGGAFLQKSIESIINQSYSNWELLCVDDSSTDDSIAILKKYAEKDVRIKVFSKTNGGNVPKSFNFVHPFMNGEFYMYMSQDDYMSVDNIEGCYKALVAQRADMAMPTCNLIYEDESCNYKIELNQDVISGVEAFYLSLSWRVHGFCLYKMSLLNGVVLDEEIYNSDEYLTRLSFLKSRKIAKSNSTFYYFQGNSNAITKSWKPYRLQSLLCDNLIIKLFDEYKLDKTQKSRFVARSIADRYVLLKKIEHTGEWNKEEKFYAKQIFIRSMKKLSLPIIFKTKRLRTVAKYFLIKMKALC